MRASYTPVCHKRFGERGIAAERFGDGLDLRHRHAEYAVPGDDAVARAHCIAIGRVGMRFEGGKDRGGVVGHRWQNRTGYGSTKWFRLPRR